MSYLEAEKALIKEPGVEQSTMMKTPCLRYNGEFFAMMFDKADALIIKVSPARVNQLIEQGDGVAFNFTKKRFKEWVLIPREFESQYESLMREALEYAKLK